MDHQLKGIIGAWTQAIGTVVAAIGSTPSDVINKDLRYNLSLYGNVLQATGNALEADVKDISSLDRIGNQIQSVGNTTVIAGMILSFSEETKQTLNIKGNFLQALGGGVALGDELENNEGSDQIYSIAGNFLQVIGNSMQAIGGVYELEKKNGKKIEHKFDSQSLEVNGSWIQAVGSVISAIGQTKEGSKGNKNN